MRTLARIGLGLLLLWCALIVALLGGHGLGWIRAGLGLLVVGGGIYALKVLALRKAMLIVVGLFGLGLASLLLVRPSHTRNWTEDQARLSWAEIDGTQVTVHNIRDFRYSSTTEWDERWYDATFDTDDLRRADFVVEPFSQFEGAAHTMVSFQFGEGPRVRHLVLSVEIRKEKGEHFNPLHGLFRQYELQYVAGDERDLVQLRAIHRKDTVYVHPIRAAHDDLVTYFLDMIHRMNQLRYEPEFYNTLTSTCTTNLAVHLDRIMTRPVHWWDYRVLLPGYSGELAFELGLIDTELGFEETQKRDRINERAEAYAGRDDFSLGIRLQSSK